MDHCFDGWDGVAVVQNDRFTLRMTSGLQRLVVFVDPRQESFTLEPVSHVNNAPDMPYEGVAQARALGLVTLLPGDTYSCDMRLEVEPAMPGQEHTKGAT